MRPLVLALDDPPADVPLAGGKGASLATLAAAGLPVAARFVVTTAAYRAFVGHNRLAGPIQEALALGPEAAGAAIGRRFARGELPADSAGVAFTADPSPGHRITSFLNAVRGLGESLVSGAADPYVVIVDERRGTGPPAGAAAQARRGRRRHRAAHRHPHPRHDAGERRARAGPPAVVGTGTATLRLRSGTGCVSTASAAPSRCFRDPGTLLTVRRAYSRSPCADVGCGHP